jgi:hypothetical protein
LLYIEKLEDENIEKQEQLEVFLTFEKEFEELKEKYRVQNEEFKTTKIQKLNLEGEVNNLRRDLDLKKMRVKALENKAKNEETGRVRLEVKQQEDAFQEEEYKEEIQELKRQILSQNDEL